MKNKKMLIALVALIAVVGILAGVWYATRPDVQEGEKSFTVTVVHSDGEEKTFSYTSSEEYVGTVVQEEGLVEGDMGEYGLYIKVVDGERAVFEENATYWAFYIGEEYAQTGIDVTPIEDGTAYRLVYMKG